jgi:hypothetical protein
MTRQTQLWSGSWWRFSRYELRGNSIVPAENASIECYDPWDTYLSSRRQGTPAPYQQLLGLTAMRGVVFDQSSSEWAVEERYRDRGETAWDDFLTPSTEREILSWCSQFGLLGILPHKASRIELPRRFLR